MKFSRKLTAVAAASAAALALSAAPAQAQSTSPDQLVGSIESASVNPVRTAQASLLFPFVGSFFLGCGLSDSLGGADNGGCTF